MADTGTWYGSDVVLDALSAHGFTHLAFNPGATLRGLHDSLVHPAGRAPEPVLALHEGIAVAVAHGFAKMAGRPMAVGLHDTVGLLHASMALFNAWADRAPVLALVGTGPLDAARRRPWIDWVHTVADQTASVRDYAVLTDQPLSVPAAVASIDRAWQRLLQEPTGPAVLAIDVLLQEEEVPVPEGGRVRVAAARRSRPGPDPEVTAELRGLLERARRPLFVVDRPLPAGGGAAVLELARRTGAVVADLAGGVVPCGHARDATEGLAAAIAAADLIVCLDVRDPALALGRVDLETRRGGERAATRPLVAVGPGPLAGRAWMLPDSGVADLHVVADVGLVLAELLAAAPEREVAPDAAFATALAAAPPELRDPAGVLHPGRVAAAIGEALVGHDWTLAAGNLGGWARRALAPGRAYASLGRSGGEGLGYAAGATVGAGLAVRGTGHVVLGLQGDGDLMYTPQALWTAAHHGIPMLMVVDDNGTYYRDELHQVAVARLRGRDPDGVGPGLHLDGPPVDFVGLARSLGLRAEGPIAEADTLRAALGRAVDAVAAGEPVLLDVRTGRP